MRRKQPTLQEFRKCNCRKKENCECKNPSGLITNDIGKDAIANPIVPNPKIAAVDPNVTFVIFHANPILEP